MSRYAQGARLERIARAEIESLGYTVIRSAGSKGPVDLVGIGRGDIWLVQVKARGRVRPSDKRKLRRLRCPKNARREIWERARGGWIVHTI